MERGRAENSRLARPDFFWPRPQNFSDGAGVWLFDILDEVLPITPGVAARAALHRRRKIFWNERNAAAFRQRRTIGDQVSAQFSISPACQITT
jgi:hypothetical protein